MEDYINTNLIESLKFFLKMFALKSLLYPSPLPYHHLSLFYSLHSEKNKNPRKFYPPESLFKYEVEVLSDSCSAEMNQDALLTVPAERLRRKKFVYTQEKNRLFIRQFVDNDCPNGKGTWKVKVRD